jgi:hypothetical protein
VFSTAIISTPTSQHVQIGGYKERLRPWKLILNTLISGLTLGAGFIIMLIVMTYDLGFLAAVLCGLMTGSYATSANLFVLIKIPSHPASMIITSPWAQRTCAMNRRTLPYRADAYCGAADHAAEFAGER